jgi:glycerol kinase
MKGKFLLAIDQGTSSSRTVIYDHDTRVVASAQQEFAQIYPRPGWVEHDPEVIWNSVTSVTGSAGCRHIRDRRHQPARNYADLGSRYG